MARVENGSQANASAEWTDHDSVHLVVDNMTGLAEIDRIYDLVIAILFVPVEIWRLTAVACSQCALVVSLLPREAKCFVPE